MKTRFVWGLLLLSASLSACSFGGGEDTPTYEAPVAEVSPEEATVVQAEEPAPVEEPTPVEEATASSDSAADVQPLPDSAWGFKQSLIRALGTQPRDYGAMAGLMGESFEIMIWYGNGEQMPPAEAAAALESTFLPAGNPLTFSEIEDLDMGSLIGGNPFQIYPNAVDFLFSSGWGASGMDEVLITIGQQADGSYYWQGILYANNGFASAPVPVSAWQPLPEDVCQMIQTDAMNALGAGAANLEMNAPFTDIISGTSGTGCLITILGTGADFPAGHFDTFMQLKNMFESTGWTPDMQYDGGGPTGTVGGFRRDSGLLIVIVGWEPSADADCPTDQPISACELTPEQMIYTITITGAMQ